MVLLSSMILLFSYVYVIKQVKNLNAEKNNKLEIYREKQNKLEQRKVTYQKLTSEDEIVRKAKEKFGLVRIDHLDEININSNQIKNLKKLIQKKYD